MSNLRTKMRFERKRGVDKSYRRYNFDPEKPDKFEGCVHGATVVIKDVRRGRRLFLIRNFGSFIGQRMNFTNSLCFPQPVEENTITGKQWGAASSQCQWLFLSHVEALYLFAELNVLSIEGHETAEQFYKKIYGTHGLELVKKFVVYRYFRNLGWVVRDGISFGCDYLLYKDGVEIHHSSAGVRIVDANDRLHDAHLIGLKRELSNCKKVLLLASLDHAGMEGVDFSELQSMKSLKPEVALFTGWNWKKSRGSDLNAQFSESDNED